MTLRILAATLLAAWASQTAFAQDTETPEPSFSLLGSVGQKLTYRVVDWDKYATSIWLFSADLKPEFTYGPASFEAESTWTLPLSASLTSSAPTVVVPQAYFRFTPVEGLDFTFGQKRLSLGVGQTFTVGDSLNPVVGLFDQKTGFRGATLEWSPVSWASASAAVSTEGGAADKLAGAGQLSLLLDQLQLTVSLVGKPGASLLPAVGASYDLWGVILTAEGAAEFLPQGLRPSGVLAAWKVPSPWEAPAVSGSAGARWTVTVADVDLTLAGEYLLWSQGFTSSETDAWQAAGASPLVALARKATLGVRSRDNAFFRASLVSGSAYSLTGFAAVDLQDQSVLGQGSAVWAPWDNLEFTLSLQAAVGSAGSAWEFLNASGDRSLLSFSTTYHF